MGKGEREVRVMKGEQEAGEWWGRARHRRMMGESRRDTQLMGESRRDTQLMGECKRQAGDGVETCRRDTRMMGGANDGEAGETRN